MFQWKPGRMYQMPVQFGPCCGPRQDVNGNRYYYDKPQECTQHILVYETDPAVLAQYLPEGFLIRRPYVIVTHKMHRNLAWLAGRGYNVVTFDIPVTYTGKTERIHGLFLLAIWENHADPILCGREQLGYSKIFADIDDIRTCDGISSASLSSWGFPFLTLSFDLAGRPETALLDSILQDPISQGKLHWKYIPATGNGFTGADVSYVTLSPRDYSLPADLPPVPPSERVDCGGALAWNIPSWSDMPTQYHIVRGLASLPIVQMVGGARIRLWHRNDVYDQRRVD